MKEEIRQKLTGAVIGLARTCENNEKTENTNRVFLEALTVAGDWSASIFDMSEMLEKARKYEDEQGKQIKAEDRPAFHVSPYVGWMNDPNGFSYYQGEYHLFYQYYPYDTHWNSMHWGHVVSKDLLHWKHLPAALAPDEDYDKIGCFSGSAIELEDGRQLLLYTAVDQETMEDGTVRDIQTLSLIHI